MFTPLDREVASYKVNKHNKHPAFLERNGLQDIIDAVAEELKNVLPHGSGINYDWHIVSLGGLKFDCCNYYQAMDQNGFYCGRVQFEVIFDAITKDFDVYVQKKDIKEIEKEYQPPVGATEEELEEWNENNPCPYLDDLEEMLYEDIKHSLEYYYLYETIKYIKNTPGYSHLLKDSNAQ